MELQLEPGGDAATLEAARRAAELAGAVRQRPWSDRGAWWRAGVAEAVEGRFVAPRPGPAYDVAPSPRRTRGATRA
jgi:hypothetical protein